MRFNALPVFILLAAACGPTSPPDSSPQATIEVMAEIRPGTPLDELLVRLDRHLVNAMAGELDGDAGDEFLRAEAMTDRLLEARMPFEWIPAESYSLESKLRQIQSSADRILAQLRTAAPRQQMLQDLRALRTDVARLRQMVAAGGAPCGCALPALPLSPHPAPRTAPPVLSVPPVRASVESWPHVVMSCTSSRWSTCGSSIRCQRWIGPELSAHRSMPGTRSSISRSWAAVRKTTGTWPSSGCCLMRTGVSWRTSWRTSSGSSG